MNRYNLFSLSILIIFFWIHDVLSIENRIVYKIDNEIITSIDITDEFRYIQAMNPRILDLKKNEIYEISKNSIIREKIKKIEILKYFDDLSLSKEFMNTVLKNTYSKIGINSRKNFKKYLESKNLNIENLKQKLAIEAKWNEIIFVKFRSKINIDKGSLRKNFLNNTEQQTRSLNLSEIIFEVSKDESLNQKYKLIIDNIRNNGYENAVLIHSISNTSSKGGQIGWVNETSLSKKIKGNLDKLKVGDFTKPIIVPGGFLILKINNIKKIDKKIDIEKELKEIFNSKLNQQLNQYSNIYFNKIKKDIKIEKI